VDLFANGNGATFKFRVTQETAMGITREFHSSENKIFFSHEETNRVMLTIETAYRDTCAKCI
jgi:hypothetical protein